jgi:hypothetical protein
MRIPTTVIPIQKSRVHEFSDPFNKWCGDGVALLCIKNATLVLQAHIAIATAILFLSQIAILRSHLTNEYSFYGKIEYKRTCELRSEERRPQRPSRKMSTNKLSVVVLSRKEMAHG